MIQIVSYYSKVKIKSKDVSDQKIYSPTHINLPPPRNYNVFLSRERKEKKLQCYLLISHSPYSKIYLNVCNYTNHASKLLPTQADLVDYHK